MIEYFDYTTANPYRVWVTIGGLAWGFLVTIYAGWWDSRVRRVPNALWVLTIFPGPLLVSVRDWHYEVLGLVFVIPYVVLMRYKSKWGTGDSKAVLWSTVIMGPLVTVLGFMLTAVWIHWKRVSKAPVIAYYARVLGILIPGLVIIMLKGLKHG